MNLNDAVDSIVSEYRRARTIHRPMLSAHEGYAVIEEEFLELRAEVFRKRFDIYDAHKEARQLAAMALSFLLEVKP